MTFLLYCSFCYLVVSKTSDTDSSNVLKSSFSPSPIYSVFLRWKNKLESYQRAYPVIFIRGGFLFFNMSEGWTFLITLMKRLINTGWSFLLSLKFNQSDCHCLITDCNFPSLPFFFFSPFFSLCVFIICSLFICVCSLFICCIFLVFGLCCNLFMTMTTYP